MKKRHILLLLTAALLLSCCGCSSLLNRSYLSEVVHKEQYTYETNSSALRVENYSGLVSAISHYIRQGKEAGTVHLYHYTGDLKKDIEKACDEIMEKDPIAIYMVDRLSYESSFIVSYYEVNLYITYRRPPSRIHSIVRVAGSNAIQAVLRDAMANFSEEAVFQIPYYFVGMKTDLTEMIEAFYYDTPLLALGMPETAITLYPAKGTPQIVELLFTYPSGRETLLRQSKFLSDEATRLNWGVTGTTDREKLDYVYELLIGFSYTTDSNSVLSHTAYGLLIDGQADSEGFALACKLLCDKLKIPCVVVRGAYDGSPYFWNIVTLDDTPYHIDAALGSRNQAEPGSGRPGSYLMSDTDLPQGYSWDRAQYPSSPSD